MGVMLECHRLLILKSNKTTRDLPVQTLLWECYDIDWELLLSTVDLCPCLILILRSVSLAVVKTYIPSMHSCTPMIYVCFSI